MCKLVFIDHFLKGVDNITIYIDLSTLLFNNFSISIFAPFFNFSYRRKRKLSITGRQLLALVSDPHQAIKKILDSSNRVVGNDLPEQLQLFEMYYADKT